MLQAQIDIVDEAGNTEESVQILGAGQVSLGPRRAGAYLHVDEAAPDLAVIEHDGRKVSVHIKAANALEHDEVFLEAGSIDFASAVHAFEAFSAALDRLIRVRVTAVAGELLGGGGVIIRATLRSDFRRRAEALATVGAVKVHDELTRLQAEGKIDQHGNILAPLPADMQPGSRTDV